MKAEELMLGSLVRLRYKKYGTGEEVVKDFQVSELRRMYKESPHVDAWSVEDGNMGYVERLEGIPLTPEILEKNGFKSQGCYKFTYMDEYCSIEILNVPIEDEEGKVLYNSSVYLEGATFRITITLEYIHELQHALRLCGIDKQIEL